MRKESERMRQLKENFMELYHQGYTARQIAKKYNLSYTAVYGQLQEIAEANNVTRRELLEREKSPSEKTILKAEEKRVKVDVEELQQSFKEAGQNINFLIDKIDEILNQQQQENNYDNDNGIDI